MQLFGFLGSLLGYILWGAFYIIQNFGLSIIVFTIIIKAVLIPFSIKQQKSMAKTSKLQKKQREIQEKYANNRQKAQEEMSKLYEKEGVKPTGGCLTSIVPMLVILGIFYAVAYPLTNTLHLDGADVQNAIKYVETIPGFASSANPTYQEISLLKIFPNIVNTPAIQDIFSASEISTIEMFQSGFNTFGVDLLAIPKEYGLFSGYILFPVFCFLSNILSQIIMQKVNKTQMQQQGCMKVMLYVLPLFSAYIAYSVPAAVGFYWIISAVFSLIQSVVLAKMYGVDKITAKSEAQHVALMFEEEAKVPYVYAPHELSSGNGANTKKKKK